jgi:HK97 family phage prohead protease
LNKTVIENRCVELKELRVVSEKDAETVVEGHASVFGEWSETLRGWFPFKEKVAKGAFSKTIGKDDIRCLFNHDPNYVLGRNRAGTLELYEDDRGLFVRIKPPQTQWARDLMVSIGRGDVSQMSFGFEVVKDRWSVEDGGDVRELLEVKLYDVSPVTFPAYTQTDCGLRGLEAYNKVVSERTLAEQAERERAQAEKAKREAEEAERINADNRKKLERLKNKFKII